MTIPNVHALVLNWNGVEHLQECLSTLLASTYPNLAVVFIDNGSTDGSVAFVRERFGGNPRLQIIECGANLGWPGGNNAGIEYALDRGADYVFLLNNDTATDPEAVAQLVAAAEARPKIGALAAKLVMFDQPWLINSLGVDCSLAGVGWDRGFGRVDGPGWSEPEPVLGVCGAAMFVRCEALRKAGPLPVEFEIYLDDLDLCMRIWRAGYEIWSCPCAVVRHKFSATMGQEKRQRRKYYLNTRNRFYLAARNFPLGALHRVTAAMVLAEGKALGRALADRAWWRVRAHTRAWVAGLAYLPAAVRHRTRRTGNPARFWQLVRRRPLFFPGVKLPICGVYGPRGWNGRTVVPLSAQAVLPACGQRLRLTVFNCYPSLGETDLEIRCCGRLLARVRTRTHEVVHVDEPESPVEIVGHRVFTAEETGEKVDLAGWIVSEPEPEIPGNAHGEV